RIPGPPRAPASLPTRRSSDLCLWSAWPFYVRAVQSVVNRSLNMFTLIGLGVSVAYGYSVVAALAPTIFPASFRSHGGGVGVYFRSEEHTSELQSRENLVCRLL